MSKATHEDLDKALDRVMGSKSMDKVVDNLEKALKVAKRLPKPAPTPTAINRSAGRAARRLRHAKDRFTPNLNLIGQDCMVLDLDGNPLTTGRLSEIRSMFEYQVETDGKFCVYSVGQTTDLDVSPEGLTLFGAHSLGDLA